MHCMLSESRVSPMGRACQNPSVRLCDLGHTQPAGTRSWVCRSAEQLTEAVVSCVLVLVGRGVAYWLPLRLAIPPSEPAGPERVDVAAVCDCGALACSAAMHLARYSILLSRAREHRPPRYARRTSATARVLGCIYIYIYMYTYVP